MPYSVIYYFSQKPNKRQNCDQKSTYIIGEEEGEFQIQLMTIIANILASYMSKNVHRKADTYPSRYWVSVALEVNMRISV